MKIEKQANKDAIALLEELIIEIKAGDITDIAVAFVTSNGGIGFESGKCNKPVLLGAALAMAERRFNRSFVDEESQEY